MLVNPVGIVWQQMSVCGAQVLNKLVVLWGGASPLLAQPAEDTVEKLVILVQKSDFGILCVFGIFRDVIRRRPTLRPGKREAVICNDRVLFDHFTAQRTNLQFDAASNGGASGNAREAPNNVTVYADELVLGTKRMVVREPKGNLRSIELDVRPELIVLLYYFAECGSQLMAFMAQGIG